MIWKAKRNRDRNRRGSVDGVKRRSRGPERLESRRLLAADAIHVGVVYLETDYLETDQDVGSDSRGDRFILSFTGGAPDTQLSELRIRTDKDGDGISVGDPIYDTAQGGRGKNGAHGFQVVRVQSPDGHQVDASAEVEDGGQELILRLSNFHAGDRLEFTLDVDEVLRNALDLAVFNDRLDVITSGQEFQDSILEASFNAPHYETSHADAIFLNDYGDPPQTHGLDLPPDSGSHVDSRPNRSAAAVASVVQVPKPIEISGRVWIDSDLDAQRAPDEQMLAGVEISLWKLIEDGSYVDTDHRATTNVDGLYVFSKSLGLMPGQYRVVQSQPEGFFSVSAVPGSVSGLDSGNAETSDTLTSILLPLGDTSAINYDFAEAQPASLSGFVFRDDNNDGVRNSGEQGIAGVRVQLVPVDTIARQSALTETSSSDGSYSFSGLAPGSYEVIEVDQPTYLNDGIDAAGRVDGQIVGVAHNPGDRVSQIFLAGSAAGTEYNFGEVPFGAISGSVYLAIPGHDCSGDHNAADAQPQGGVDVELQTDAGVMIARTTTGSDGRYRFEDVPVGNYRIIEFTPGGLIDGSSHVGRVDGLLSGTSIDGGLIQSITMTPAGVGVEYNFCEAAPASISGYVYQDQSNDGSRDANESGIAGTRVSLIDASGQVVSTQDTDGNGRYQFLDLAPGEYSIVESQPDDVFDGIDSVGNIRGQLAGHTAANDVLIVSLKQGDIGQEFNFGELSAASLFGRVHVDADEDCSLDDDEQVLAGVTIRLLDVTGEEVARTTTDSRGQYSFQNIEPGEYTVVEDQPTGFFEGKAKAGSAGGIVESGSRIGNIMLGAGETAVNFDFCERPPSEIFGSVFNDHDGDCRFDSGETGIEGVRVELYDDSGNLIGSATTDATGNYRFTNLAAGNYTIREIQPSSWFHGGQRAGSGGGDDSTADAISQIPVGWGERLTQYSFCELEPSSISGSVFVDGNGDRLQHASEPSLQGVTIELRNASGQLITQTTTNANGRYTFDNLAPGDYEIFELQPDGYFHGGQISGTGSGKVLGDDRLGVNLQAGQSLVDHSFPELEPSSISGIVFVDRDGDRDHDNGEPVLEGVTIELRNASGQVITQTTTNANGRYTFNNLAPGDYEVVELQPDGYFHGGQTTGTGSGKVLGDDRLVVNLQAGQQLVDYSFYELEPASISGFVHFDDDGDCEYDPGENPIEGVAIELRDATGNVVASTTTNAAGQYAFEGLEPGRYQVFEQQPDGFFHAGQTPGSGDGEVLGDDLLGVNLRAGQHLVDYKFCELAPSSISGQVWHESEPNRQFDQGDTPLPGVLLDLVDESGKVIAQTQSDSSGNYTFTSLAPGVFAVHEHQPAGYFQGGQIVGDTGGQVGGDDVLVGITLLGGTHAKGYDFSEVPPATLSGFVFQDGLTLVLQENPDPKRLRELRDGILTADDQRLGGVTLQLRNVLGFPFHSSRALPGVYDHGPIQTTTNANGYYEFTGLRPGTYHVYQAQPERYVDGLDTPGTAGGVAVNPADQSSANDRITIQTLALDELTDPADDAILNITLVGGGESRNNNFSEIFVAQPQPQIPQLETLSLERPTMVVTVPIETFDSRPQAVSVVQQPSFRNPTYVDDEWAVSWHLSVINGGFPRGTVGENGLIRGVSTKSMRENWKEGDHDSGKWTIASRNGSAMESLGVITLGDKNATALAGDFDGNGSDEAVIFVGGQWFVDLNGNGRWDAGDLWIQLGTEVDRPVVGDWDGDGKDDIGIFGRQWQRDPQRIRRDPGLPDPDNRRRRQVDSRHRASRDQDHGRDHERLLRRGNGGSLRADAVDHVFQYGEHVDTPIAGDWNGDGIDQIAVFRDGTWLLDADGDGRWTESDHRAEYGQPGDEPIVGDFNGDEIDEIGIVRGDVWIIDSDGDRRITGNDLRIVVPRENADSQPVVGDFDNDGKDEPGYYDEAA